MRAAAFSLALIHGYVRRVQQRVGIAQLRAGEGDADRGVDLDFALVPLDRTPHGRGDLFSKRGDRDFRHADRQQQREFVSAKPRDGRAMRGYLEQAICDRAQHGVAGGVAVDIVDRLEAVEINQHHRESLGARRLERGLQRFGKEASIGEARERVVTRRGFGELLGHESSLNRPPQLKRFAHHGDQRADADAESEQNEAEEMPLDAQSLERFRHAPGLGEVPATGPQRHQRQELVKLVRSIGLATKAGHRGNPFRS